MKHILQSNDYIWNIEQKCLKNRTRLIANPKMWMYSHVIHNGYKRRYYET